MRGVAFPGKSAVQAVLTGLFVAVVALVWAAWSGSAPDNLAAAAPPFDETPVIPNPNAPGDNFGYAVASHGNTLVAGAQWVTVNGQEKAGAVYVFTRSTLAATQWTQVARLTASDGAAFDQFGAAVAVSGDTVAVGATLADVNGSTNQGAVYIFERNQGGPNQWGEVKKLTIPNGGNFDNFGDALAAQGDELFVGAKDADVGGSTRRGAVYVYRSGDGWSQPQELIDPNGRSSDSFGAAIAVAGNWLVVGAERADVTGNFENDGAALLFRRTAPGAPWTYVKRISASDADGSDQFGASVAIRGDRVLVGAPAAEKGSAFSVGKAYVFNRSQGGTDNWGEVGKLAASDGLAFDSFGIAVALGSNAAYVGARNADVGIAEEGAVYVFEPGAGGWSETGKVAAGDGTPNDSYGASLVTNDEMLVVGAYRASDGAGKVYAYTPGAPPQPSSVYLPLTFNPLFVPNGVLKDGGVVTTPEGVRLGAVPGALESDLPIVIRKTTPPPEPLPPPATVVGDYFQIAGARELYLPLDTPLILALPVPDGINTDHLGVAAYVSGKNMRDVASPIERLWNYMPGTYDSENQLLLIKFPHIAPDGDTVVLVEHPDFEALKQRSSDVASNDRASLSANFTAFCFNISCQDSLKKEIEDYLQTQFAEFLFTHEYPYPRLYGTDSDTSIDPPEVNQTTSDRFYVFVFDRNKEPCTDEVNNKRRFLGAYSEASGHLNLCFGEKDTLLLDVERDTIRHEYFHALQFGFSAVLKGAPSAEPNDDWILESTAEAAIKSGNSALDWKRVEDIRDIRKVDITLEASNELVEFEGEDYEYEAQDFWVFTGRQYLGGGLKQLRAIFSNGPTFADMREAIPFDEAYWAWVKNQVYEKTNNLNEALGAECTLEEAALDNLLVWKVTDNTSEPFIGTTEELTATVVEVTFPREWAGEPINLYVQMFPDGVLQPPWLEWKIYKWPNKGCSAPTDNQPLSFRVVPGERYFVVVGNWLNAFPQDWQIFYE